jgi:hypothetical protein
MEAAATTTSTNGKREPREPRGRKDKGQEQVIKISELSPAIIGTLVADLMHAQEAATVFDEGVKRNAKVSGIQATVLRKFIAARASKDFEDRKRDSQQLWLLFDELPGPATH